MKDFDSKRREREENVEARTFRVCGEDFTVRASVAPEALDPATKLTPPRYKLVDEFGETVAEVPSETVQAAKLRLERDTGKTLREVAVGGLSYLERLGVIDELIIGFLEPEHHEKWVRLRDGAQTRHPITYEDMDAITDWLIELETGRPIVPPSPSTNGSGNGGSGTSLTAGSSSPGESVSTA